MQTFREQKKTADKQRKLAEKAHRIKEESLRDDDNVFDVAFENQGAEAAESTVSATDIKVCCALHTPCLISLLSAATVSIASTSIAHRQHRHMIN